MGRKNKKKDKSPAPTTPPSAVNDKDLINSAAYPLAKTEKKLLNELESRYPEVKERISLKQQSKKKEKGGKNKSGAGDSSSTHSSTSPRRIKNKPKSIAEHIGLYSSSGLAYKPRPVYRHRSKEELKQAEFGWKPIDTVGSFPPSDYTVTHVNQDHDLLRLDENKVAPHMNLSSSEWLKVYSLETMKLTLKDLLAKGTVSK